MRRAVCLLALAAVVTLAGDAASADDGLRWRRTTPRASVERAGDVLSLRVPAGRAWGVESAPLAIEPGQRYRARVRFEVAVDAAAESFLRIAFYARADGRGPQRARRDSRAAHPGEAVERNVDFDAPAWARSVKVRLLLRRGAWPDAGAVRASGAALAKLDSPSRPQVVLREVFLATEARQNPQ